MLCFFPPFSLAVSPLWGTAAWGRRGSPSGPTATASPPSSTSSSTLSASGTSSPDPIGMITCKSCGTASQKVWKLSQLHEGKPWSLISTLLRHAFISKHLAIHSTGFEPVTDGTCGWM